MSKHTYLKVRTIASFFFKPENIYELKDGIDYCRSKGIRYVVLGRGSKVLFTDKRYEGCVIKLERICRITKKEEKDIEVILTVEAGVTIQDLLEYCVEEEYSGLEFLAGMPGTVGGAIFVNAGAFGREIGRHVESVFSSKQKERVSESD